MSYLEELLPEFRKGAKIRVINWPKPFYYQMKKGRVYNQDGYIVKNFSQHIIFQREWELYKDPEPDWQCIIDHKCLCEFWDDEEVKVFGYLCRFPEPKDHYLYKTQTHDGFKYFKNCCPVRRDEVTFYGDKKDDITDK